MMKRVVLWGVVLVVVLGGVAMMMPASPVYLPKLFNPAEQQGGHSLHYWMNALKSSDPKSRHEAILSLGSMGDAAAEAVPDLAKIMTDDPDEDDRFQAALALSKMVPASRTAVPALAQALQDKVLQVRMQATIALFRLHGDAQPAVPALIKAFQDKENNTNLGTFHVTIQEMAALALGGAGGPEALSALQANLDKVNDEDMRAATARALGEMGPAAQPALPQLETMAKKDDSPEVRRVAKESLEKIKGEADKGKEHEGGEKGK
jgi:HEAT repeat protein